MGGTTHTSVVKAPIKRLHSQWEGFGKDLPPAPGQHWPLTAQRQQCKSLSTNCYCHQCCTSSGQGGRGSLGRGGAKWGWDQRQPSSPDTDRCVRPLSPTKRTLRLHWLLKQCKREDLQALSLYSGEVEGYCCSYRWQAAWDWAVSHHSSCPITMSNSINVPNAQFMLPVSGSDKQEEHVPDS